MKIQIDIRGDIGQQMKTMRQSLNLTLADIAIAIGESEPLLSYYENNKRKQNVDILKKFLNHCDRVRNAG
jgi:transcriptional regulator with XRE-family HTH domain